MTELERARANLADAQASLAAGTNPYAAQNLASARSRLARLEAAACAPTQAPPPPTPAPVASKPAPVPPQPVGTREERLVRLADAWGVDDATLGAAIDNGTKPDEFALICSEEALLEQAVQEIMEA